MLICMCHRLSCLFCHAIIACTHVVQHVHSIYYCLQMCLYHVRGTGLTGSCIWSVLHALEAEPSYSFLQQTDTAEDYAYLSGHGLAKDEQTKDKTSAATCFCSLQLLSVLLLFQIERDARSGVNIDIPIISIMTTPCFPPS